MTEIFVSAGESSSDIHLAHILASLKKRTPELRSFGLGGDRLAAEGAELLMHNREFSSMGGPLEVFGLLPKRRRLELSLEERIRLRKPDLAILVDNGEINLRLASLLHFFRVPVVYFIPPKVWVWRHSRMEKLAQHVNLVLSILPFEAKMYKEWEIPFSYVGNPLIDEVPKDLAPEKARGLLGLDESKDVVAVFPGSRHSEIRHHVELFSASIKKFREMLPAGTKPVHVAIPVAPSLEEDAVRDAFRAHLGGDVSVHKFASKEIAAGHACLAAARSAIVKSGTSTLEAALLGTPMVLSYKSSGLSEFLFKHLARYRGFIGMANLFLVEPAEAALGWTEKRPEPPIPEMILKLSKPELIAAELLKIHVDGEPREKMLAELARAKELCKPPSGLGASPIEAAADAIHGVLEGKLGRRPEAEVIAV